MMDQMGNEPRPRNNDCSMDVVWSILHSPELRYKPYNSNSITYRELLKKGNEFMLEVPEYSLAAWYCGGRDKLLIKMKTWLIDRNTKIRRKVRGVLRSLAILYLLYKDALERYYLPGNKFEQKASLYWNPILANDGYSLPSPPP